MKIIPKALYGTLFIAQSDNTRVNKPVLVERRKYKPKPNEFFFTDRRTGKKVLVKRRNETVSPDNRSNYLRYQSLKLSLNIYRKHQEDKKQKEGMKNLLGLLTLVTPSTYVGPVFNNNGKSYILNVMSGLGTGDVAGNVAIDMLTPFAVGGAKSLATGIVKYPLNVGRRAVETVMRTSSYPDPLLGVSNGFKEMLHGNNGGKTRLFHIGNYILTGKKTGQKGYYNSLAPYIGIYSSSKKVPYPYRGVILYSPSYYTDENDIIDAFLYQKTIDPKFGVQKVEPDYGIHTDYVNKWYPNKKILVYEVLNNSNIPNSLVHSISVKPVNDNSWDFGTNQNNIINVAGHLKLNGIYDEKEVIRRQDIWKFNPTEYKLKWINNGFTYVPLWKKKLLDMGLRYVDRIGTPVITRTKWIYATQSKI